MASGVMVSMKCGQHWDEFLKVSRASGNGITQESEVIQNSMDGWIKANVLGASRKGPL
jgi:hypothetical protein